jgi:hypothetical protein
MTLPDVVWLALISCAMIKRAAGAVVVMKRVMNVTLIDCRILLKAMLLMELLDSLMYTTIVSMVNRTI